MFGQKFTNTNEMLQCTNLHCADFVAVKLAQLNTANNNHLLCQKRKGGEISFLVVVLVTEPN
jgi:hypothetical protein